MKNKIYQEDNGLTMVKSTPFNWIRESVYATSTDEPYYYKMYVGGLGEGHYCIYHEDERILSIFFSFYSSDDPTLKFKVDSIEEAGEIVKKFVEGMGGYYSQMEDTIYLDEI